MKLKLAFLLILALAILPPISRTSVAAESDAATGKTILIIRHAEPQAEGDGLSAEGEARAAAYAAYFKNITVGGRALKIDHLFATADTKNSHRPRLTIEPTSQALGLPVDASIEDKQVGELADRISNLPQGAIILICWHHGEIPDLLRALGADPEELLHHGKWPEDVFNWLILLQYDGNGRLLDSKRIKIAG